MGAGGSQAMLVGLPVMRPELTLVDVGGAELPVLVGFVNTFQESPFLLILGKVQKELDGAGPVAVKVLLQV